LGNGLENEKSCKNQLTGFLFESKNYKKSMQNTPPPTSNGQHQIVRQHHKVSPNFHNKFSIDQMLATNSDECIRCDSMLNSQKCFCEYFLLTRYEVDVRIIDLSFKIKDFVSKKRSKFPQREGIPEEISSR
jgi:hypothetical protein